MISTLFTIMAFGYKQVLIIGATSGIGKTLVDKLVQDGSKVIVAGRRKENLNEIVQRHGSDRVSAKAFYVTQLEQNPDLDCIFVNSGIQRPFDYTKPETIDLDIFDQELITNYTSAVRLTKAFLPHLQSQKTATAIAFTTSQMALVPMMRCPNYGASKAALHHFILALRTQLQDGPGDVRVLEIYPPAVQIELHDSKHQPDLKDGHLMRMPLQEFVDEAWDRISAGEDQIPVGSAKDIYNGFEEFTGGDGIEERACPLQAASINSLKHDPS
ncbi:Short-chain dehydrogenase/oxidoreductase, putative [Penicillium digitatum Pd1]|uniref:Short-chain dehydrogenase/oxidoreductase, putative n=1 Tax=Penicillium digitatum (strain Pd1 / CECT 20795) TaxID=1170230 RepID=K9GII1_PEND1|nr:Short-chain dehydrogenase/oxidoreductase, putative [Penicillium digitatum Pd1]EKV14483.1 Short-chain dehydrogenase/oxidoreductase, putative [Penicillium digitatum Pd1]